MSELRTRTAGPKGQAKRVAPKRPSATQARKTQRAVSKALPVRRVLGLPRYARLATAAFAGAALLVVLGRRWRHDG
jgi:hypothetical protein